MQVNKSSSDFWNNLTLTWKKCADLPIECFATSVTVLDGKVFIAVIDNEDYCYNPLMYDLYKDEWSVLPSLPCVEFSLVAVPCKKQLLVIGGLASNEVTNKVYTLDEDNKGWTTPYPNMPTT